MVVFPLLVLTSLQVILELSDSKVAPSGMVIAVFGSFAAHSLNSSSTTGVGIAIPAGQVKAKGRGDATSVIGAGVGAGVWVGAWVGRSVGIALGVMVGTEMGVGGTGCGANN